MKLNWNIAREMFMVSIPLWLFWAMIKDHLGHVKYTYKTLMMNATFFCTVASVFYFLSSSLVSSPPTYCSPNTHDTKSCLLCVNVFDIHSVCVIREV